MLSSRKEKKKTTETKSKKKKVLNKRENSIVPFPKNSWDPGSSSREEDDREASPLPQVPEVGVEPGPRGM